MIRSQIENSGAGFECKSPDSRSKGLSTVPEILILGQLGGTVGRALALESGKP